MQGQLVALADPPLVGHVHGAVVDALVHRRARQHLATARRDPHELLLVDTARVGVDRADAHVARLVGQRCQRFAVAGHRTARVVTHLAHRAQHERIALVGLLGGRTPRSRLEATLSVGRGEDAAREQLGRAVVVGIVRGLGEDGPLSVARAGHLLVRRTGELGAQAAHFVPDFLGVAVVHRIAHARGQVGENLPVVAALALRRQRGGGALERAVRRGVHGVVLGPRRGGQHHVGQRRGLGHEDVLADQQVEAFQRGAHLRRVGLGLQRVFTEVVERADRALGHAVRQVGEFETLLERQAFLVDTPGRCELRAHRRVAHALVAGIQAGPHAHVAAALHVVLAAHRRKPARMRADMPGDHGQRRDGAHGLHALRLLRHAHPPADDSRIGVGVAARRLADGFRREARNFFHVLGRIVLHDLPPGIEARRVLVDEIPVGKLLVDDRIRERVQQRQVRPVLQRQVHIRDACRLDDARIAHDEIGPTLLRVHDAARHYWMAGRRVVAEQQDAVRLLQRGDAHAHGTRSDDFHEPDDAGRVTGARAVVDVVRAQTGARELLHHVVGLVTRAARRTGEHHRFGTVLLDDGAEPLGREIERPVPGDALERRAFRAADHRMVDARREDLRVVDEIVAVHALQAQLAFVRDTGKAFRIDDLAVFHHEVHLATGAAVRAHRHMLFHEPTPPRPEPR